MGRMEALTAQGLGTILDASPSVRVLARDIRHQDLERVARQEAPSVVIVDETADYELLSNLKVRPPSPGVLVVAEGASRGYGTLLVASGITCVARSAAPEKLHAVVALTAAGESIYLDAAGVEQSALSARERDVLALLREGNTPAEIAATLSVSLPTVRTHVRNIKDKSRKTANPC
jgi:DNA-binding NarL/FixJ family response regulator